MARPSKAVAVMSKNLTKAEIASRSKGEAVLKGDSDALVPPDYLTQEQADIFRYIVTNLEASGILGNLDVYVLTECSICIDRMQSIEAELNERGTLDPKLVAVKEKYTKAFFRYCNELSLSPQSRAKLANINAQAIKEENPLVKLLSDDD